MFILGLPCWTCNRYICFSCDLDSRKSTNECRVGETPEKRVESFGESDQKQNVNAERGEFEQEYSLDCWLSEKDLDHTRKRTLKELKAKHSNPPLKEDTHVKYYLQVQREGYNLL